MNRLLACAAAALLLSACASTEKELADKGMKPLDAAKVRTLLSGSGFMIYNAPDGTTRGKSGNSSPHSRRRLTGRSAGDDEDHSDGFPRSCDGLRIRTRHFTRRVAAIPDPKKIHENG